MVARKEFPDRFFQKFMSDLIQFLSGMATEDSTARRGRDT